ncbi:hypothetical protein AAMO2058_001333600 [Amorphochlora amoebiformis]
MNGGQHLPILMETAYSTTHYPLAMGMDEKKRAEIERRGEEEGVEAVDVFSEYKCHSLGYGKPHPGAVTESLLLASVDLPSATYPLLESLPSDIISEGKLSELQLESLLYASQRHLTILGTKSRAGFFIGDGAGVGKGRQVAGIILESLCRGERKHLWFSTSAELRLDAERDLTAIGCHSKVIDGCRALDSHTKAFGLSKEYQEGILFCTYSTLVSVGRTGSKGSRLDQIIRWCGPGYQGCIIFDECHKAKNFCPGRERDSTKVGLAAIHLQRAMPRARVVYCSATGLSDVKQMAFMERLGLWGPGTSFISFEEFSGALETRGIGAFEILALEMKAKGMYVARSLSFKPCEFDTMKVTLMGDEEALYNNAVKVWMQVKATVAKAIELTHSDGDVWKFFWSAHQNFFRQLVIAFKTRSLISDAKEKLSKGYCVVIGLQTTGEASTMDVLSNKDDVKDIQFVSLCKEILIGFLKKHFPTKIGMPKQSNAKHENVSALRQMQLAARMSVSQYSALLKDPRYSSSAKQICQYLEEQSQLVEHLEHRILAADRQRHEAEKERLEAVRMQQEGLAPETHPKCMEMKAKLIHQVYNMNLPPAALDYLIDKLGGPQSVAEMTGRRLRIIRSRNSGKFQVETRFKESKTSSKRRRSYASSSCSGVEGINIAERNAFVNGNKHIAIISDAASTGVSLHSSIGSKNAHLRRVHYTLELPWSAEKCVQQLGRSNRSNQVSGPIYRLLCAEIGGEKRFAAAVARRLQALGALTRGDRRAASGDSLQEFDVENKYGRFALKDLMDDLRNIGEAVCDVGAGDSHNIASTSGPVSKVSIEDIEMAGLDASKKCSVKMFLNRTLGLPIRVQNNCFEAFFSRYNRRVSQAKVDGSYTTGVATFRAEQVTVESQEILYQESGSNAPTVTTVLYLDRGISYKDALQLLQKAGIDLTEPNISEPKVLEPKVLIPKVLEPKDLEPKASEPISSKGWKSKISESTTSESKVSELKVSKCLEPKSMGTNGSDTKESEPKSSEPKGSNSQGSERKAEAKLDNEMTIEEEEENLAKNLSGFRISRKEKEGKKKVILAILEDEVSDEYLICRPNTGRASIRMDGEKLERLYRAAKSLKEAKILWETIYDDNAHTGKISRKTGRKIGGSRFSRVRLIHGPMLTTRLWPSMCKLFTQYAPALTLAERSMHVVSVTVTGGHKFVGIRLPDIVLAPLLDEIKNIVAEEAQIAAKGQQMIEIEAPKPVDTSCRKKATRKKLTMLSFFSRSSNARAKGKDMAKPKKRKGNASSGKGRNAKILKTFNK